MLLRRVRVYFITVAILWYGLKLLRMDQLKMRWPNLGNPTWDLVHTFNMINQDAHKKTGHQKKTHPESDIHLHKVCAPPPPFPYTQIPRKHKTHTRPLIGCTPNNLYAFFMWCRKAAEKTETPTERHTWYDIHLHRACAPTLPSTQASRKTDAKFQPLNA